jgi:hypothetical protein
MFVFIYKWRVSLSHLPRLEEINPVAEIRKLVILPGEADAAAILLDRHVYMIRYLPRERRFSFQLSLCVY